MRITRSLHSEMASVSCLHGSWVDGACECDDGYVTEFTYTELYPIYCAKKQEVLILDLRKGFAPLDILHYTTMSLTVGLATGSFLGLLFFLYTLLDACLLGRRIKKAEMKLKEFMQKQIRRDSTENLNAELWYPDLNVYRCINDPGFTAEKAALAKKTKKIVYAKVLYNYKPHGAGELRLCAGDTIKNVTRLNKGWCKGNLNGKFGFYPEAYAEMFQPTASDIEEDGPEDQLDDHEDAIQAPSPFVNKDELRYESGVKMGEEAVNDGEPGRENYTENLHSAVVAHGAEGEELYNPVTLARPITDQAEMEDVYNPTSAADQADREDVYNPVPPAVMGAVTPVVIITEQSRSEMEDVYDSVTPAVVIAEQAEMEDVYDSVTPAVVIAEQAEMEDVYDSVTPAVVIAEQDEMEDIYNEQAEMEEVYNPAAMRDEMEDLDVMRADAEREDPSEAIYDPVVLGVGTAQPPAETVEKRGKQKVKRKKGESGSKIHEASGYSIESTKDNKPSKKKKKGGGRKDGGGKKR